MDTYKKWAQIILYKIPVVMLIVYSVCIAGVSLMTLANQEDRLADFAQPFLFLFPGVVIFCIGICFFSKQIEQWNHDRILLAVCFSILLLGQLLIVFFAAKIYPISDSFRTLDEAAAMPSQNGLLDNFDKYYAHYPNNYLFTILMYYVFFPVRWVGIPYVTFAVLLNVFMIDLAVFLGYILVKELFGVKRANIFLFVSVLCPTNYVFVYFPYTNTFSMPFVLGIFLFGLKKGFSSKAAFVFLSVIGYGLRPTTIFATIGVLVYQLCGIEKIRLKRKGVLRMICLLFLAVVLIFAEKAFVKSHLANPDNKEDFPVTHWIMVGLKGTGELNGKDVKLTAAQKGKDKKIAANLWEIKKRVRKLGFTGVMKLYFVKTGKIWSIGTDDFQTHNNSDAYYSRAYESIFGKDNTWLVVYCQIFRCATFLFIIVMLIQMLVKPEGMESGISFVISLLGIIVFLMMWETNKKHSICYTHVMLIMMQCGIHTLCSYGERFSKISILENSKVFLAKRFIIAGVLVLVAVLTGITIVKNPFLSEKKPYEKRILYRSPGTQFVSGAKMKKKDILQKLKIRKKFDIIKLYVKKVRDKGDGVLKVQVFQDNMNLVAEKEFTKADVEKSEYLVLNQLHCPAGKYQLVVHAEGDCSYANIMYDAGKVLERYEGSALYFGGEKMGTSALSVLVYDLCR